jgi:hypothetical protein
MIEAIKSVFTVSNIVKFVVTYVVVNAMLSFAPPVVSSYINDPLNRRGERK